MKAISLIQPWASAIAWGLKKVETRSWKTDYRGKLLICASKKATRELQATYENLCSRTLVIKPSLEADRDERIKLGEIAGDFKTLGFGVAIAYCDLLDCQLMDEELIASVSDLERMWGYWRVGRYAWQLGDILPVKPIPVKGALSLFGVNVSLGDL